MATENPSKIVSAIATNAIDAGVFLKRTVGDGVTTCNSKGEASAGVSRHGTDAGEAASLQLPGGYYIMKAGGALEDGAKVITSAEGKPLDAATEGEAGEFILGEVSQGSFAEAEDDPVTIYMYSEPQVIIPADVE